MEAIEGVLLYEVSELEGLSKADTGKIKAFASRTVDRNRPAYARFRENHPRETIFIGTTNEGHYLTDQTGNRRFWPVRTAAIDIEALQKDRDQLWAEAAAKETQGASIVLPQELWSAAAQEQEERMVEDGWYDLLSEIRGDKYGGSFRVSSASILTATLGIPKERQTQAVARRVAGIMRRLGWEGPKQIRMGRLNARGYEKPAAQGELQLPAKT